MMHFTKLGLSWSNQQTMLRSRELFMVVECISMPLLAFQFFASSKEGYMQLGSLPDVQALIFSQTQFTVATVLTYLVFATAAFGLFGAVCKSSWMLGNYSALIGV